MGTRKCPHNLNSPHFAGVFSYECPHKCATVSAHTHKYKNRNRSKTYSGTEYILIELMRIIKA